MNMYIKLNTDISKKALQPQNKMLVNLMQQSYIQAFARMHSKKL